ncbi:MULTISPECIES: hypothetical protein [Alteromonas]|jgi:hypothetical protein|uniref:hypothetical protein n=1 Tax=Alteromonas TaxID=226 RepID=UPI000580619C|nr:MULTISPECIES: hypothetical protein [Alteromonas]KHT57093.1 hypothetical protein RJ43_01635 [Alteromonas macleodii]CAI2388983.1 hypothetical protein ALT831_00901 [Alteromonas macleodii]CAI3936916.1 hypothetical protein ALTBGP9_00831 [Alteromonas macleodii]CAI3937959.1 hypothetical protein ALTBGP6_00901 [Alteromonas macleodii]CAI3938006.1 hypothetical protein ALTBGP14_00901 [Alteromonas macleodii]|tara:strand:- start:7796 stop:8950 length:1155 start_codon:yes stop_codon:yes gene_type:complete
MSKSLLKLLVLSSGLLILSACSNTPDLTSFAQESKNLRTSVNTTHQEILQKINDLNKNLEAGKVQGWVKTDSDKRQQYEIMLSEDADRFQKEAELFIAHTATIDGALAAMVSYSDSLANLAAAGETGAESVESLTESVKSISDTLSLAYPPSAVAYEGFTQLLSEVADIYTRIEAQDTLALAMEKATPAVENLVSIISIQSNLLEKLTVNIVGLRVSAHRGMNGPAKIGYYEKFNAYKNMEYLYESILNDCTCNRKETSVNPLPDYCGQPKHEKNSAILQCHLTRESALTSRLQTLERVQDNYINYNSSLASEYHWAKQMESQLIAIAAAAEAWSSAHKKTSKFLANCGGTRSLKSSCNNLTVNNLKSAIERLKAISEGFDTNE